jgi:hypothetical protein
MNTEYAPHLVFVIFSTGLLLAAFRPAWSEWRRPTDTEPLQVMPNYTSDIDHFADQFRTAVVDRMSGDLASFAKVFDVAPEDLDRLDWSHVKRPVVCLTTVKPQRAIEGTATLFVHGDLETTVRSEFQALLAQGSIRLAPGSVIREWAHGDGVVHLGKGCTALRRLSSSTSLELEANCCFERLQAPLIQLGLAEVVPPVRPARVHTRPLIEGRLSELDGALQQTPHLTLVQGNCKLPRSHRYQGSLIVTGRLSIGAGTEIFGDVKARGGVVMGAQARVHGALCSEQQLQLLEQASVRGPVVSESVILLGAHVRLGLPDAPTTVSASHIMAEAGAVAHGTVWAREGGVVWAA